MFETLLNILSKDFKFPDEDKFQDFDIISLTTKRVLLSDDFVDFFDYFSITSQLQERLYEIYYFDDKKITIKQDNIIFNETIFNKVTQKDEFFTSKFWQYDSDKNILRKHSEQMIAPQGRFYEKNVKETYQEIIETKINNAELLLTRYKYKSDEENFENFNWFYGKIPQTDGYTIRFYFSIMPDSEKIAHLINVITKEFDRAGVAFIFKYLSDPQKFNDRNDVAVLYTPRKSALLAFDLVRIIYEQTYDKLFYSQRCPLFTKKLADGLSFGENPDDRRFTSFGSYRSIYIAMAIIKYYYIEKKYALPNEDVLKELLNNNLEILKTKKSSLIKNWTDNFYLNQYSKYNYSEEISYFKHNLFNHKHLNTENRNSLSSSPNTNEYLETAYLIAQTISREAHFYPSKKEEYHLHCNWVSYSSTNFSSILAKSRKQQVISYEFKALNSSFLQGRLGVAYFLKKLFKVKKDQNIYRIFYRTFQGVTELIKQKNEEETYLNELKWFYSEVEDNLLSKVNFTAFIREHPADVISPKFKIIKRNSFTEFHKIIDKVVGSDYDLSDIEKNIVNDSINDLKEGKPFLNFHGNEEMCLDIVNGYALLGYFFLRLHDKQKFQPLSFQFENK